MSKATASRTKSKPKSKPAAKPASRKAAKPANPGSQVAMLVFAADVPPPLAMLARWIAESYALVAAPKLARSKDRA